MNKNRMPTVLGERASGLMIAKPISVKSTAGNPAVVGGGAGDLPPIPMAQGKKKRARQSFRADSAAFSRKRPRQAPTTQESPHDIPRF